uniref:MADF domain-containing protein n=1 Tax=Globodera pallida TaxID=36090 RepID=A0A183BHK0_GLOPA
MSISAPPTLSEDVLYAVAEQMLFTRPPMKEFYWDRQVDLRQENAYTNFMCLSPSTFKVFVAQFVKMKHIVFEQRDCVKMYKRDTARDWTDSEYVKFLEVVKTRDSCCTLKKLSTNLSAKYSQHFPRAMQKRKLSLF